MRASSSLGGDGVVVALQTAAETQFRFHFTYLFIIYFHLIYLAAKSPPSFAEPLRFGRRRVMKGPKQTNIEESLGGDLTP